MMNSRSQDNREIPYEQLVKRVEVLEERMRAHFGIMAIIGAAVALDSSNHLIDMLAVYRDRHLPQTGADMDPIWSDVVIANEINAVIAIVSAQGHGGLRVIQGGLS